MPRIQGESAVIAVLSRVSALIVLACCFAFPGAVFAQTIESATFTVNKNFSDNNPETVSVSLSCTTGNVTSSPLDASEGNPAQFEVTDIVSGSTCTATEVVPSGYNAGGCNGVPVTVDSTSESCTIYNTAVCGNNVPTYAEQCDDGNTANGDCCSSTCQFEAEFSACGEPSDVSCDAPDSCDGAGVCVDRVDFEGTECRGALGVCDEAEFCDGSTDECPADVLKDTTFECNAAAGVCDEAELCTGTSVDCPVDELKPAHTECRGTYGNECDVAEVCSGTSVDCPVDGFASYGTLCGDAPDFACEAQDICDGSSDTCIPNPEPLVACGVIGKGDGCELNICDSEGPSDFKLLFTPDLPNWVAYKLNASNPGQLFYTLVSEPDVQDNANLLLQVPFPFVTQGNMTLHVFDADDVSIQDDICLVIGEGAGSTPYPVEITMDTYWDATGCTVPTSIDFPTEPGAYCKHVTGPNPEDWELACPSDYDPDGANTYPASLALQECWAYVPVQLENQGQFAARLHLDYGLKGKHLDTYCPSDETVDRYAPGAKGAYGDFAARGIDVNYSSTSNAWLNTCNIPTCQPYTFKQGVESEQASNCYEARAGGDGDEGCNDPVCEEIVCGYDPYCCDVGWDSKCADEALADCSGDPVPVDPAESVIQSVNYFKKPVGIFGRAECTDGNDPLLGEGFGGLVAKLYKTYAAGANGGTPLAQSPTDADGYYFLNYKHKGKAVYYHVELWSGGILLAETANSTSNPGAVPLQANGFAELDFFDTGSYVCSTANNLGWVPGEYSITKGKFKTIVTP